MEVMLRRVPPQVVVFAALLTAFFAVVLAHPAAAQAPSSASVPAGPGAPASAVTAAPTAPAPTPTTAPAFTPVPGVMLAPAPPAARWVLVPRVTGRLRAADIGLVINTADPYSVAVGEHYIRRRGLAEQQVLRLQLPTTPVLTVVEFAQLLAQINNHFGPTTQALALAWKAPYAVDCNSITGALALGYDGNLCSNGCQASRLSPYFNSASSTPYTSHQLRPAMLLAADTEEQARELINRGVRADHTLARSNRAPVNVMLLQTDDPPRRVRMALYPPTGLLPGTGVRVNAVPAAELPQARRVLLAITGSVGVDFSTRPDWVPGGLGDHLTSLGGALIGGQGQSTALEWISSGATASHGTVSEPCNHLQKFPHPQLLLLHYLQGATALEAYWKSVAWPQQSLFIGEPLAAPFAPAHKALLGTPTPAQE